MVSKSVTIIMSGGGFGAESKPILERLNEENVKLSYVVPKDFNLSVHGEKVYYVNPITRPSGSSKWSRIFAVASCFFDIARIFFKFTPDIVIGLATPVVIPVFLVLKLKGSKRIFIESLTRSNDLSLTGKIVYYLGLSSRFYVQWPTLVEKFHRCVYRGMIYDFRNGRHSQV